MSIGAGLARGWGGQNRGCCGFGVIAGLVLLIMGQVCHSFAQFEHLFYKGSPGCDGSSDKKSDRRQSCG